MANQLTLKESGADGIRRIVLSQLGKAHDAVKVAQTIDDETVHNVRRRLKRARAGLRLLREALGAKRYHRENNDLRDAARPLTEARDAKVLVDTLDKLRDEVHPKIGDAFDSFRFALTQDQNEVRQEVLEEEKTRETILELLADVIDRGERWPVKGRGWSILGEGVERTYRAGRKALDHVREERTVEALHEWRKQTKYLRYQLAFLRPVWPTAFEDLANDAHKLGGTLGDDHDFAVLRDKIDQQPERFNDRIAVDALFTAIDGRRIGAQGRALQLGERLYNEKPSVFIEHLESCWHSWRAQRATHAQ